MPPTFPCDCARCMRGGRTTPRMVSRSTYNLHAPQRNTVSSYSSFVASQTGRLPQTLATQSGSSTGISALQEHSGLPATQLPIRRSVSPQLVPKHEHLNVELAAPNALPGKMDIDQPGISDDNNPLDDDHLVGNLDANFNLEEEERVIPMEPQVENLDVEVKVEDSNYLPPLFVDDEEGVNALTGVEDDHDDDDNLGYAPQAGGHVYVPEPAEIPGVEEPVSATLDELKLVQEFIKHIKAATLDEDNLPASIIESLRSPSQDPVTLEGNEAMRSGIDLFVSLDNETEAAFDKARNVFNRTLDRMGFTSDAEKIPSLFKVKDEIKQITGVYPIIHDMCPDSCMAYTGPLADRDTCLKCALPRYQTNGNGKKKPQRQFLTLPLGPQLQSMWRTKEGAKDMRYRRNMTRKIFDDAKARPDKKVHVELYEDIFHGSAYLDQVCAGNIKDDDMVLMLSIDGAQLYESKQSDCWIYIWVIMDLSPDKRYKKRYIFPGGFFPGPNKPGIIESFLFPGFHHLSALMKEGLRIWDAYEERLFLSHLFLILGLADGPGLTYLNGLTGHSGMYGCRLFCPVKGRRKEGGNHYYPALMKPENYTVDGCDHPSVPSRSILSTGTPSEYNIALNFVMGSKTQAEHQRNRKMTGVSRPSILSALPGNRTLPAPHNNGTDLMHLAALNITDLFISHWRGTMECDPNDNKNSWVWAVLTGDVWKNHGQQVANARPFLPGSFDRPPRNIAEKISSGYKAWEFLTYFYGLGPGLLYGILPEAYWKNYCKLVIGMRILHQRRITREQLVRAYTLLIEFVDEYEALYYQGKSYRLHFCRQSIHAILHLALEVARLGPPVIYTQWPMERAIGSLGEEIFQHSTFYANLAQRGTRRAQINALMALIPADFPEPTELACRSEILGGGYFLSMADERSYPIGPAEVSALREYLLLGNENTPIPDAVKLRKWARLQLPNRQFVRTAWKEVRRGFKCRRSRNIMYSKTDSPGVFLFAEVQYFFQIKLNGEDQTVALVSNFGSPDATLLSRSSGALIVCRYLGISSLSIIPVKCIISCIAMIPFSHAPGCFYVCEKMGMDMAFMGGIQEPDLDA